MTMVSGTSEAMIPPGAKCRTLLHLARLTTSSMPSAGRAWRLSGEDDLAAGGEVVELADGDDVLDMVDEVVLGEAK
jgi:hypothetical protein